MIRKKNYFYFGIIALCVECEKENRFTRIATFIRKKIGSRLAAPCARCNKLSTHKLLSIRKETKAK